jgi:hypothetical protein
MVARDLRPVAAPSRVGQDRHSGCMQIVGITSTGIARDEVDARRTLGPPRVAISVVESSDLGTCQSYQMHQNFSAHGRLARLGGSPSSGHEHKS